MENLSSFKSVDTGEIPRKLKILETARNLFNEKGYAASTVRDIAQEVGIEAPSIYSHYKSKEDILQNICFEMANAYKNGLERSLNEANPREKLIRAIKEHIQVVTKHMEASAVMWNEWKHMTEPHLSQFQQLIKSYGSEFAAIIQSGVDLGTFRKQNVQITSNLILSSLNSLSYWFINEDESQEDLEKEIIENHLSGILK